MMYTRIKGTFYLKQLCNEDKKKSRSTKEEQYYLTKEGGARVLL